MHKKKFLFLNLNKKEFRGACEHEPLKPEIELSASLLGLFHGLQRIFVAFCFGKSILLYSFSPLRLCFFRPNIDSTNTIVLYGATRSFICAVNKFLRASLYVFPTIPQYLTLTSMASPAILLSFPLLPKLSLASLSVFPIFFRGHSPNPLVFPKVRHRGSLTPLCLSMRHGMRLYIRSFLSRYPILTSNTDVTVLYRTKLKFRVSSSEFLSPFRVYSIPRILITGRECSSQSFLLSLEACLFVLYPSHVPPFSKNIFIKTGGG